MRTFSYVFIVLLSVWGVDCLAQGSFKTAYIPSSSFKDDDGNKLGSGDLLKISGRYSKTLSVKQNQDGLPIVWTASVHGAYGILTNKNMQEDINPDKILNAGVNLAHIRPLSEKWYLVAGLGGGIYSAPNDVTFKSILVNGAAIFVYRVRNNLDLGIGIGLTNSFGAPVVMPMSFIKWKLSGKYEINVDIASGMEISAAMRLNDRFKLKLVAMEMDGMSSVIDVEGKSMIYASTMMRSYLSPEMKLSKASTLFLHAGGTWQRTATLTGRTFKDFTNNLFHNKRKLHFLSTGYLAIGVRYGF